MSLEPRGNYPQRLLPQSLEDRLLSGLARTGGFGLLVATICVWATLATWSVEDPSLTHATTLAPRNALGALGAVLSDLFLQTFGFVAVLAMLPPLLWSVELLRSSRLEQPDKNCLLSDRGAGARRRTLLISGAAWMAAEPRLRRRHRRRPLRSCRQTVRRDQQGPRRRRSRLADEYLERRADRQMHGLRTRSLARERRCPPSRAGRRDGPRSRRPRVDLAASRRAHLVHRGSSRDGFRRRTSCGTGPDPANARRASGKRLHFSSSPVLASDCVCSRRACPRPPHGHCRPAGSPSREPDCRAGCAQRCSDAPIAVGRGAGFRSRERPRRAGRAGRRGRFPRTFLRRQHRSCQPSHRRPLCPGFPRGRQKRAADRRTSCRTINGEQLPEAAAGGPRPAMETPLAQSLEARRRGQARPRILRDRHARQRPPARRRLEGFRRQGRGEGHQARPRRHALRTRARARHQILARHRPC